MEQARESLEVLAEENRKLRRQLRAMELLPLPSGAAADGIDATATATVPPSSAASATSASRPPQTAASPPLSAVFLGSAHTRGQSEDGMAARGRGGGGQSQGEALERVRRPNTHGITAARRGLGLGRRDGAHARDGGCGARRACRCRARCCPGGNDPSGRDRGRVQECRSGPRVPAVSQVPGHQLFCVSRHKAPSPSRTAVQGPRLFPLSLSLSISPSLSLSQFLGVSTVLYRPL